MNIEGYHRAMITSAGAALAPPVLATDDEVAPLLTVISDYRIALASQPLDYSLLEIKPLSGVTLHRYQLNSQSWSLRGIVAPDHWQHEVECYIPDAAKEKNALVVINNGGNNDRSGKPAAPTNFLQDQLHRIASHTRTIIISVSNVPNQTLNYQGNSTPLAEDDSVAYSWMLFMQDPQQNHDQSLHIPMCAAVSQAMRLAKRELAEWNIDKFVVTGTSKRGWTAWLTAISDPDVNGIVAFAIDLLGIKDCLRHMYKSYGSNWPVAFNPYYKQGIDKFIDTDEFEDLMQVEDPLSYINTSLGKRLKIKKYIINASGDDFYVPDNSRFYYNRLPGVKSLRMVPNVAHEGIVSITEQSLISFINRFQHQIELPELTENVQGDITRGNTLTVRFSEPPASVIQWTAHNTEARDFRYASGVNYLPSPVDLAAMGDNITIPLSTLKTGWQATYLEATFHDGYVATSQVYISPDEQYPAAAGTAARHTLPGRGLLPGMPSPQ